MAKKQAVQFKDLPNGERLYFGNVYNCDGNVNHISYEDARALMHRVEGWHEFGRSWADRRGGYEGGVDGIQLTLSLPSESQRGEATLRVGDTSNEMVLAAYRSQEIYAKFFEINDKFKQADECVRNARISQSVARVRHLLQEHSKSRR